VVTSKSGNWRGPQVALNYLERCDVKVFVERKGLPRLLSHEADHTNFCGNIIASKKIARQTRKSGQSRMPEPFMPKIAVHRGGESCRSA
jgi:hypothetical protein